jgi:hypothetical protein
MKHLRIVSALTLVLALFLTSCQDNNYLNTIPRDSKALISIDMSKTVGNKFLLQTLLKVKKVDDAGIDLSSPVMMFSSTDGNIGLCAKVSDEDKLTDAFKQLHKLGLSTEAKEFRDYNFLVIANSWLVGYSSDALLLMGPIAIDQITEQRAKMARMLKADEDEGITSSPLYEKLCAINEPMAMVATVDALPDKLSPALILGAPKGVDASQICVSAKLKVSKGKLYFDAEQFSLNPDINAHLAKAKAILKPIKGDYISKISADDMIDLLVNVDGKEFLPMLQADKPFQTLLTGINTAIDMDNIIRSVNGEMLMRLSDVNGDNAKLGMIAQLADAPWIADVSYWKQSCPKGSTITDWQRNAWHYQSGNTSFYFGVTTDNQFYSGSTAQEANTALTDAKDKLSADVQQHIKGKSMALIINVKAFDSKTAGAVSSLIMPMFGNISSIVISR